MNRQELLDNNYILITPCATTLANWKIVDKHNETQDTEIYVRLEGNKPFNLNYNLISKDNIYVCYGNFLDDGNLGGEKYKRFYVKNWDILYPINRNSIFDLILPDNYICNLDLT